MSTAEETYASAVAAYMAGDLETARRRLEAGAAPETAVRGLRALCRVRLVLTDCPTPPPALGAAVVADLARPFGHPRLDADRLLALGWLHWLAGEWDQSEPPLAEAAGLGQGEAAYWLARVRLRLGRSDAVEAYEATLRELRGSPRATCWYADLLWRAGRAERAEAVWKTVRGSRRVAACDDAAMLDARLLLRRGQAAPAERLLWEAAPRGGVAKVERLLLLAWAKVALRQPDQAALLLDEAAAGPYPARALSAWRTLLAAQRDPDSVRELPEASGPLAALVRGERARIDGQFQTAIALMMEARSCPVAEPFARYALAALGQDDFTAVLACQPGLFLATRCRARLLMERFRRRGATSAELLDALRQAAACGYQSPAAEHWQRLVRVLGERKPSAAGVRPFAIAESEEPAAARNRLHAAVEAAARNLSAPEALELLLDWSGGEVVRSDPELRELIGGQLLRLAVLHRPRAEAALASAEALLAHPLVPLLRNQLLAWADDVAPGPEAPRALGLWHAARTCSGAGQAPAAPEWRDAVARLSSAPGVGALAVSLLLQDAAQRRDLRIASGLLADLRPWRSFAAGPPRFVVRAVAHLDRLMSENPGWRDMLARWLALWDANQQGAEFQALALAAGVLRPDPEHTEPPAGMPRVPWLLHQAARLGAADARQALAWVCRALGEDWELTGAGERAPYVRAALAELQRHARAQALGALARFHPDQPAVAPGQLADMLEILDSSPEGQAVLRAADEGDVDQARSRLAALADGDTLPARLAHHLALCFGRAARFLEEHEPKAADPHWHRAWRCWLRWQAQGGDQGPGHPVLDWLLDHHRRCITTLLARNEVAQARRHWGYVQALPELAREGPQALRDAVAEKAVRFRDDLTTDYLLATREQMRAAAPDGWRADYPRGLGMLTRLLSLDRGNVRLLTALMETCADWFLDCYDNEDLGQLAAGVERFTPFALQLARLVEAGGAELSARAALAEFYKFRGFVAEDRAHRVALYREALRFHPGNENVRRLLAELGEVAAVPRPQEAPDESE